MQKDVSKLFEISEEELLFHIGQDIMGRGARGESRDSLIQKAKDWMSSQSDVFRNEICSDTIFQSLMTISPIQDRQLQLVTAISDLLSSCFIGIPTITISVMLARVGLDKICKEFKSNDAK